MYSNPFYSPQRQLLPLKAMQSKRTRMDNRVNGLPDSREYDFPWFNQENDGSSSEGLKGRILPPKKRFRINSSLMAWKPDPRQQLILDNLWSSIKDPQKGEETINALVLHMEEQSNSKASLQWQLCQKIDSLQTELSLQKAQTQAFLQNRLAEFDKFTEHFAEM
ncbi:hypothetical protein CDL15_Pgr021267 [Punica granatum]|uniref:Uncharacterized protein n=1 Tax=Punica granatum TaxID=22663 RepID=A0A218WQL2_PUNGR|nr:hypothetical protein CDL15_Pgr021267 [Punica granatum]